MISALAKWREMNGSDSELSTLIDRGVLFLLRNAGPDGAWSTTQASVQALAALLSVWEGVEQRTRTTMLLSVNKRAGTPVVLEAADVVQGPATIDISRFMRAGRNEISFSGGGGSAIQVQATASWYEPWSKPERNKTLEFSANCGPATLAVNELSQCDISVGRRAFSRLRYVDRKHRTAARGRRRSRQSWGAGGGRDD